MSKRIPLNEASLEQLRLFAEASLGLELSPNCNSSTLVNKIKTAAPAIESIPAEIATGAGHKFAAINVQENGWATFSVEDPNRPGKVKMETDLQPGETPYPQPHVKIQISASAKPGGDEPVPVSVNGAAMWIPRKKPAVIPLKYALVLQNAVEQRYEEYNQETDMHGGLKAPNVVQSYDMSIMPPGQNDAFEAA